MKETRILVWDVPLRVFHWLLAVSFAGAFLTAESERYRTTHVMLGYAFLGLLAFRLVWAVVGSRYARLSSFAFGPGAVLQYLESLLRRNPLRYIGHNPAGSWVIYALVLLGVVTAVSGWGTHANVGGHWVEEFHEGASSAMLGLVAVHIAGVIVSSFLHCENLAAAMVTGYKRGQPDEAMRRTRWTNAVGLVLGVGVLAVVVQTVAGMTERQHEFRTQRHEHSREHAERG